MHVATAMLPESSPAAPRWGLIFSVVSEEGIHPSSIKGKGGRIVEVKTQSKNQYRQEWA